MANNQLLRFLKLEPHNNELGLKLYASVYGEDKLYKRASKYMSAREHSILINKLTLALNNNPAKIKPPTKTGTVKVSPIEIHNSPIANNDYISNQKKSKNTAFVAMSHKHKLLKLAKTKKQRLLIAEEVITQQQKYKEAWHNIDYYNEHGHPPILRQPQEQITELHKRLTNVRSYVSNYKKRIKLNPNSKKIDTWKQKLFEFEEEVKELESKLCV